MSLDAKISIYLDFSDTYGSKRTSTEGDVVPLAGIEPALLAETDFESVASTSSAIGAFSRRFLPK